MAKFFVGQRVRVVETINYHHLIGAETRVACIYGESLYQLELFDADDGLPLHCFARQIEPIIPEGMKPSTWDQCEWQPEGVCA